MLIEFSVENFLSIKEKQTLSLIANKSNELSDNVYNLSGKENFNILCSAVIYGANAAGKSNLIVAMIAMKKIVMNSSSESQSGEKLSLTPFKLNDETITKPTEFETTFIIDGIRYQYGFSATEQKIHDEWLFAYPKGRAQKWFYRFLTDDEESYEWEFGGTLLGEKQLWLKATRDNALFLSTAVQLNSEQLKPIFKWFQSEIQLSGISGWNDTYSAKLCEGKEKEEVLKFLKAADIGVEDIKVKKSKIELKDFPASMPDELKKHVIESLENKVLYQVLVRHTNNKGEHIYFELQQESHGTQKIFALAGPLLDSLKNGRVLFIDELHDTLHPKLVLFLVKLFNNPKINTKCAQLIFTTHDTSILNQNVFRRDQVWFCEKNNFGETNLYPLTDYSPRKGRENLEAAYLAGKYGAVPFIGKIED